MKALIINVLIALVLLSSCEKTIKSIELDKKDPKLVLHGFIGTDSAIVTSLSVSRSSLDADYILTVDNGFVDIFEGDELVVSFEHDYNGFYVAQENNLQPSKQYTIRANSSNYPEVECTFTIPKKIEIVSLDTTVRTYTETWDGGEAEINVYSFSVKLNDPEKEENFYIIRIYRNVLLYAYDSETGEPIDSFYNKQYVYSYSDDISAEFGLHDTWIEEKYENEVYGSRGICFTDAFISGKTGTFSFDLSHYELYNGSSEPVTYYIALESITKDYYTFLKSYSLYDDTEYDPFAQKVNVFNNVEGGFGIIGAYSQTIDSVSISIENDFNF